MNFILRPFHLVVLAVASALNHEQAKVIEYLKAENGVLREQLSSKGGRIRFTDKQRCRLAAAAKDLGRQVLRKLGTIVTPDTLLRWQRSSPMDCKSNVWGIGSLSPATEAEDAVQQRKYSERCIGG
jgi:hypothetical protein